MTTARIRTFVICLCTVGLSISSAADSQAGTIVRFDTNYGSFDVELFDSVVPTTVDNFLDYVTSGSYADTWLHRSISIVDYPIGFIQGGGYTTAMTPITTNAPIPLEYVLPNTRGTISMARTLLPNSATSQWFINTSDNSDELGPGGFDANGYAVFGEVLGNGMDVVDAINALPRYTVNSFSDVPAHDYSPPDAFDVPTYGVIVNSITVVPEPSTAVLASMGIAISLVLLRRKRR